MDVLGRRRFLGVGAALALTSHWAQPITALAAKPRSGFTPPTAAQRTAALGSLKGLSAIEVRAFDPADHFEPMGEPEPGDWLAEHVERGQTFDQFRQSKANRPDKRRSTIYFLPLGEFDPAWSPEMADLEACARAFFQIPVKALPTRSMNGVQVTSRERVKGPTQYLTTDFLRMLRGELPDDGYCILGVTMQDLYPDPKWNYVFGQASLRDRVGIYSFARYDPLFWKEKRTPEARELLLVRSLEVLLHETCHMFGMSHCIYYKCLVNGSNNLEESDRQPMHLCPICLRKLQHSVGFDVVDRDKELLKEYRRLRVTGEAEWLERRLRFVKG